MGLAKTASTSFGVEATYWRLSEFKMYDYGISAAFAGYVSQAARDAGAERVATVVLSFNKNLFDGDLNIFEQAYILAKSKPEFELATDV